MKCDKLSIYCKTTCIPNGLYYDKSEVDAAIAELKTKLESVQASMYADVVDANMENRKLKRALYKACVNWMTNRQGAMRCYDLEARAKKFDKAIAKCRAKAEEYK